MISLKKLLNSNPITLVKSAFSTAPLNGRDTYVVEGEEVVKAATHKVTLVGDDESVLGEWDVSHSGSLYDDALQMIINETAEKNKGLYIGDEYIGCKSSEIESYLNSKRTMSNLQYKVGQKLLRLKIDYNGIPYRTNVEHLVSPGTNLNVYRSELTVPTDSNWLDGKIAGGYYYEDNHGTHQPIINSDLVLEDDITVIFKWLNFPIFTVGTLRYRASYVDDPRNDDHIFGFKTSVDNKKPSLGWVNKDKSFMKNGGTADIRVVKYIDTPDTYILSGGNAVWDTTSYITLSCYYPLSGSFSGTVQKTSVTLKQNAIFLIEQQVYGFKATLSTPVSPGSADNYFSVYMLPMSSVIEVKELGIRFESKYTSLSNWTRAFLVYSSPKYQDMDVNSWSDCKWKLYLFTNSLNNPEIIDVDPYTQTITVT